MKEHWKNILKNNLTSIYQKGEKYLIINDKEITLQTNKDIFKRKKDNYKVPSLESFKR